MGSWEWRPGEGRLRWSEGHYRLLGYEPGEVAPTPGPAARPHARGRPRAGGAGARPPRARGGAPPARVPHPPVRRRRAPRRGHDGHGRRHPGRRPADDRLAAGRHGPPPAGDQAPAPGVPRPADRPAQPGAAHRAARPAVLRSPAPTATRPPRSDCALPGPGRLQGDQRRPRAPDRRPAAGGARARACGPPCATGDTVARLGGDEFVVLCEGLRSEHDAVRLAERLATAWTVPFTVAGRELFITASTGIAHQLGARRGRRHPAAGGRRGDVPRQGGRPRAARALRRRHARAGQGAPARRAGPARRVRARASSASPTSPSSASPTGGRWGSRRCCGCRIPSAASCPRPSSSLCARSSGCSARSAAGRWSGPAATSRPGTGATRAGGACGSS